MFGAGSVFFGGIPIGIGGGSAVTIEADEGITLEAGQPAGTYVLELGSPFGVAPVSVLEESREINTNTNIISFDIFGDWTLPTGNQVYLFIGQNPFSGVHGVNLGVNYSVYPPATVGGLEGYCISAADQATTIAWARSENNDGFLFGYLYVLGANINPVPRINMFDSGNTTFNSQNGVYPSSQDIDTGINWFMFGDFGFSVLGVAGANPITSVGWDTVTGELLANNDPIFDSVTVGNPFGTNDLLEPGSIGIFVDAADWSVIEPEFVMSNNVNGFTIQGLNSAGLSGDYTNIAFNNNATINLLISGNMLFSNSSSGALSDSGSLAQFFGDVDVNGNLNVSTGATGSFTTVDLKTVTVANGIITAIV